MTETQAITISATYGDTTVTFAVQSVRVVDVEREDKATDEQAGRKGDALRQLASVAIAGSSVELNPDMSYDNNEKNSDENMLGEDTQ